MFGVNRMFDAFVFPMVDFQLSAKWYSITHILCTAVSGRSLMSRERFSVCLSFNKILLDLRRNTFKDKPEIPNNREVSENSVFGLVRVVDS